MAVLDSYIRKEIDRDHPSVQKNLKRHPDRVCDPNTYRDSNDHSRASHPASFHADPKRYVDVFSPSVGRERWIVLIASILGIPLTIALAFWWPKQAVGLGFAVIGGFWYWRNLYTEAVEDFDGYPHKAAAGCLVPAVVLDEAQGLAAIYTNMQKAGDPYPIIWVGRLGPDASLPQGTYVPVVTTYAVCDGKTCHPNYICEHSSQAWLGLYPIPVSYLTFSIATYDRARSTIDRKDWINLRDGVRQLTAQGQDLTEGVHWLEHEPAIDIPRQPA